MNHIAIVGLGYVGLPLSLQFARSGVRVLGLDIDDKKTTAINSGHSYIKHVAAAEIEAQLAAGKLEASTDFSRIGEVDAVVLCVPTPLDHFRAPDLSYVLNTGKQLAPFLKKGTLVVLESTTYPGTTDGELRAVLEEGSGLVA
ncbi:MAG TPA: NAD(P)-binding domain-containing protein, partial [Luteolibacter sp.]